MKIKLTLIFTGIMIAFSSFGQEEQMVTRKLSPFDEIKVFGGIDCELVKSDEEKVELFFSNINSDDIVTELSGMQLKIRLKIKWYDEIDVKAIVYYKEVNEFTSSAGSSLYSDDIFKGKHLEINSNTGSEVELKLDADYVEISSEQGSKVYLHGNTNTLDIEINTGGELLAFNTRTNSAMVKISAGGLAEINVSEEMKAEVNLGGTVKYQGNPAKVSQNTSLGGSIINVEQSR